VITDLHQCSDAQLREQINYLRSTPVAGIARLLDEGRCCLMAGTIRSLTMLGSLKTEFGQIGCLKAPHGPGERKFRVAEVLPLLEANPGIDAPMLRSIRFFMLKDECAELVLNTTILNLGSDLVIKDGNKRTIAFFERRRASGDDIAFRVHVVQPVQGHGI
jgi:hypothetical protein